MWITKKKLNYYFHKTLSSTFGEYTGKQNKVQDKKECIDMNDVIQAKHENTYIFFQEVKPR